MKRMTPRKVTAKDRININRFWNEMEDFYSRLEEQRSRVKECDREVEEVMARLVDEDEEGGGSGYVSASSSSPSPPPSPSSPLPRPPSIPQTRLLLGLVERMTLSRVSTPV